MDVMDFGTNAILECWDRERTVGIENTILSAFNSNRTLSIPTFKGSVCAKIHYIHRKIKYSLSFNIYHTSGFGFY
jgi:hypothetical protein